MKTLLAIFTTVFLTTFLATPMMGAGWFWDTGNGLGFAAFSGLLYLGVTRYRRFDVRAHRLIGYSVLGVLIAHVLWFLSGDAAVIEYISISAPDYMWLGIIGLILLFILVIISVAPDRQRVHKDFPAFLYWHRGLALAAVACSAYHIAGSNFYLAAWYQVVLFVAVATAATFGRSWWIKIGLFPVVSPAVLLLVSVLFTGLFSVIRNLPG